VPAVAVKHARTGMRGEMNELETTSVLMDRGSNSSIERPLAKRLERMGELMSLASNAVRAAGRKAEHLKKKKALIRSTRLYQRDDRTEQSSGGQDNGVGFP